MSAQIHSGQLVPGTAGGPSVRTLSGTRTVASDLCKVLGHVFVTPRGDLSGLSVRKHSTTENNWLVVTE